MSDEARTKAQKLMRLALATPFGEEARTAAVQALKLINEHGMLDESVSTRDRGHGLSAPPKGKDAATELALLKEITRLKNQISTLKKERRSAPAPPPVPPSVMLDIVDKLKEIESLRREVARLQAMPRALPVAMHIVRPGDSPMAIARVYTGNPHRFTELVGANPQKPSVITPSGWRTFRALFPGERLRLPVGWT